MTQLWIAMVAALGAPIVFLSIMRARRRSTLTWRARSCFWIIALFAVAMTAVAFGPSATPKLLGLGRIVPGTIGTAVLAILTLMATTAALSALQRLAGMPIGDRSTYQEIVAASAGLRTFAVLTAGTIEEILYRGIGIGVGAVVLRSGMIASILSTAAFVAAHFRWRSSQLIQVAAAGTVLAVTYVRGGDLWACIVAHTFVDAIGFLAMPALIARRSRDRRTLDRIGPAS